MKIVLIVAAFVAVAVAAPAPEDKATPVPLLQYDEKRHPLGPFSLFFETGDGLKVIRQAEFKPTADGKDQVLVQTGSQIYTGPDGKEYKTVWSADENGYRAEGEHLPVAPSAPSAPSAA